MSEAPLAARPPVQQDPLPAAWPDHLRALPALIEAAGLVSFDFFDTLFIRPLADAEDAFDILGESRGIVEFRARRRAAQAGAFRVMQQEKRGEIDLDGIYRCFDGLPDAAAIRDAEYVLEQEITLPNPEMIAVFRAALAQGKPVVVTSDMYLRAPWFTALMRRHGLPEVPLFISADRDCTKRDFGALFDLLSAETGVPKERILHIGDNAASDIGKARERGLVAFHYREPRLPPRCKGISPAASLARALIRNHQQEVPPGSLRELGFQKGGPAALGFLDWIAGAARRDGIEHLLFVSRDGHILRRMAEQARPEALPPSSYLLGSRVAFTLAAMTPANFESHLPFLLSGADGLSPAELLARIDVPAPGASVLRDLGLGPETRFRHDQPEPMRGLLKAWRWEILKIARRNRRGLLRHLLELGLRPGQRVALVDVGWNGTTQEAFVAALRGLMPLDVTGYYFCLADSEDARRRRALMPMESLVGPDSVPPGMLAAIHANRVAAEFFFSAPHDPVIGYRDDAGGVVAVEDPGRAPTDGIQAMARELEEGMLDFARHHTGWTRRLGLRADPLGLAMPLLEEMADGSWADHPRLRLVRNFDSWASSANHTMWLTDYAARP